MTVTAESSATAIRERVRDARARRAPVRIVGGGTWLDAGSPVDASERISTAGLDQIVDYVPGDLTLTAGAGTSLRVIAETTRKENQWLALDPLGSDDGTIGATLATASFGALATGFGTPRDLALGMEFVTGRGDLARAGGRVVKNVAGFDITRLMTGAWGTLGIITEISVRLHARPERDVTLAMPLGDRHVSDVTRFLKDWPFTPSACEVVNATLAQAVGVSADAAITVRLAGNETSVAAQIASLTGFGDCREVDVKTWRLMREAWDSKWTFRLSRQRSKLDPIWAIAVRIGEELPGSFVSASPWRGIVRCALPPDAGNDEQLLSLLSNVGGATCVVERLPPAVWRRLAPLPPNPLAQKVRNAFDPDSLFNPGILRHVI